MAAREARDLIMKPNLNRQVTYNVKIGGPEDVGVTLKNRMSKRGECTYLTNDRWNRVGDLEKEARKHRRYSMSQISHWYDELSVGLDRPFSIKLVEGRLVPIIDVRQLNDPDKRDRRRVGTRYAHSDVGRETVNRMLQEPSLWAKCRTIWRREREKNSRYYVTRH